MMWKLHEHGDALALIDNAGHCYTYAEMAQQERALARCLPERGLVFCLCANAPGSLLGYVTFLNRGIVPLLLDAALDRMLLDTLTEIYKPDYLWVPQQVASQLGMGEIVYVAWGFALIKTAHDHVFPLHKDLALLLTTSGSTGSPKLVRHTYDNLQSNIRAIVDYLGIDSTERAITTLPMHYTYGLSVLNIHLHVGASLIMTDHTVMQKDFWRLFKEFEGTSLAGVPYTYEMLHKLHFFRMNLPSLRSMNQAGGKMPPELQNAFIHFAAENNKRFYVMYGQTEASPRMGYLPWEKAQEKYGCMGIAIPGGTFSLVDANDKEIVEPDTIGELLYTGPNVTPGYAECGEDLCKGDERHGVLRTGDMARRDADGFYTITGRKQRFLKIFGNRVSLDETEHLIKQAFPHIGCVCAGVDTTMYVFITQQDLCADILELLSHKTRLNPSAFKVRYLEKLPVSETGKMLYRLLEQYYD